MVSERGEVEAGHGDGREVDAHAAQGVEGAGVELVVVGALGEVGVALLFPLRALGGVRDLVSSGESGSMGGGFEGGLDVADAERVDVGGEVGVEGGGLDVDRGRRDRRWR